MIVTEVELLMWNSNKDETAKMLEWLDQDEKFLFDWQQRFLYGFTGIESSGRYNAIFGWHRDNITAQTKCQTGKFIDFRFTMNTYTYPKDIVTVLHQFGWKVKSMWREGGPNCQSKEREFKWGDWKYYCDTDFPLWSVRSDRARQEGDTSRPRRMPVSDLVHKFKRL